MTDGLRLRSAPVHVDREVNNNNNNATSLSPQAKQPVEDPFLDLSPSNNNSNGTRATIGSAGFLGKIKDSLQQDTPASAIFLLTLVAFIWGTQHAVIKLVVDDSQAAPFTLLRFTLAALLASPYAPGLPSILSTTDNEKDKVDVQQAWRWGAEMGFWMFLGFSFQAVGLMTTTAQRSGFLLYLNVKFVPFFARVLLGRSISIPTWVSAFTAFAGTVLLAVDQTSVGFNVGDAWSIAAAASSAMFILRLEKASQAVPQSAQLNSACLWVVATLAAVWTIVGQHSLAEGSAGETSTLLESLVTIAATHPLELLYLGGVTTALANYIQTKAQKEISPERASIIYSADPVFGAMFSWLLLGETLGGTKAIIGAGMITVAAATNAFLDFGSDSRSNHGDTGNR